MSDIETLYDSLMDQLFDGSLTGQKRKDVVAAAAAIEDEAFQIALDEFRLATSKFNEVTAKLNKAAAAISNSSIRKQITKLLKKMVDRRSDASGDSENTDTGTETNSGSNNNGNSSENGPSGGGQNGGGSSTNSSGSNTGQPSGNTASPIDPTKRQTNLEHLHPVVRAKVQAVKNKLDAENIPMRVFEAYRPPERQAYLYAQGRTRSGPIVTKAEPWESYHQYGMAADFVRFENGSWNWNDQTPQQKKQWDRFHEIAREEGLEPLSFERPHVQLIGTSFTKLLNGKYPDGGDVSWSEHLSAAVNRWPGSRKPPAPEDGGRPPLEMVDFSGSPAMGSSSWTSMFGGDEWKYDSTGVYTAAPGGTLKLWRTLGSPITAQSIVALFGKDIAAASKKHDVPPALIVMTIATETAAYRQHGFTGTKTFRWEQHVELNGTGDPQIDGIEKGDYSAGPMQVLSNTARWMNNVRNLGHDNATTFKFFKKKPNPLPADLGLYNPSICIDVGTAYIKHNMSKTGDNPLLVAAAYNAGSLRETPNNRWRIHCHGNHIDRAAEWYGDACTVLNDT